MGGVTRMDSTQRGYESDGSGDATANFPHFCNSADYLHGMASLELWSPLHEEEGLGEEN